MSNQTIKNVAKQLGYSTATISRVINNQKGVSKQTRQLVLNAMDEIGYHPNRIAQSLVKKKSKLVGVIVPDFANDFLGFIVNTIEESLEANGYHMLLFSTNWNTKVEKEKIQLALQNQVDGIILKPTSTKANHFCNLPVPTVLVSQTYGKNTSWVDIDNVKSGYIATEHLVKCGYKRIAFVGDTPHNVIYTDRYQGYCDALKENGLEPMEAFFCSNSIDSGFEFVNRLYRNSSLPDAVFCCDDTYAIGIMSWAKKHGLSIPNDFGVIGFNDSVISKLPQINLTTIAQPKEQIGRYAVQILMYAIEAEAVRSPQKIMLSPELVIRATTLIKNK